MTRVASRWTRRGHGDLLIGPGIATVPLGRLALPCRQPRPRPSGRPAMAPWGSSVLAWERGLPGSGTGGGRVSGSFLLLESPGGGERAKTGLNSLWAMDRPTGSPKGCQSAPAGSIGPSGWLCGLLGRGSNRTQNAQATRSSSPRRTACTRRGTPLSDTQGVVPPSRSPISASVTFTKCLVRTGSTCRPVGRWPRHPPV